jgi:hypothetical protein
VFIVLISSSRRGEDRQTPEAVEWIDLKGSRFCAKCAAAAEVRAIVRPRNQACADDPERKF